MAASLVCPRCGCGLNREPKPVSTKGRFGLTDRQAEYADLVLLGMPNKLIAKKLGITEGGVKNMICKVFDKIGVSRRTELAAVANRWL